MNQRPGPGRPIKGDEGRTEKLGVRTSLRIFNALTREAKRRGLSKNDLVNLALERELGLVVDAAGE